MACLEEGELLSARIDALLMSTQLKLKFVKCPILFLSLGDFVIICVIQNGLSEHLIKPALAVVLPAKFS